MRRLALSLSFVTSRDRALGKERYEVFGGGRTAVESLVATSLATFAAVRSLRSGAPEVVDAPGFVERALR